MFSALAIEALAAERRLDEPVLAAAELRQTRRRTTLLPRRFLLAVTPTRVVAFRADRRGRLWRAPSRQFLRSAVRLSDSGELAIGGVRTAVTPVSGQSTTPLRQVLEA